MVMLVVGRFWLWPGRYVARYANVLVLAMMMAVIQHGCNVWLIIWRSL